MEDVIFTPIVFAVGLAIHAAVLRFHDASEGKVLGLSFAFHVVSSIGLILVYTYYYTEGGDMITYHRFAVPVAEALRYDFEGIAPEVLNLLLQQEHHLPFVLLEESSTGTMQAIVIILSFLLGNSIHASAMVVTIGSFFSKVLVYRAFRDLVPEGSGPLPGVNVRRLLLLALMLSPSGVVWTSGLLKEPVVMACMGPFLLGLRWLFDGRRVVLAVAMALGAGLVIAAVKPYILLALGTATGAWVFWGRAIRGRGSVVVKPSYVALAAAAMVGSFSAASAFFPKLTLDTMGDTLTNQRRAAALTEGGSNFQLEDPGPGDDELSEGRPLSSQLALAPLALVTALFRPFIFEARRAMQALNALEMTWLLILLVQGLRLRGLRGTIDAVSKEPLLVFAVVFVMVLALGTGLSTSNLGALSRYRAPMMPFFLFLLLVLRARPAARRAMVAGARPQVEGSWA
jgi:hypothetical protein